MIKSCIGLKVLTTSCLGCQYYPFQCKAVNPPDDIMSAKSACCGNWRPARSSKRILGSVIELLIRRYENMELKRSVRND